MQRVHNQEGKGCEERQDRQDGTAHMCLLPQPIWNGSFRSMFVSERGVNSNSGPGFVLHKFTTSATVIIVSVLFRFAGTGLWSYRTVYAALRERMSVREETTAVSEPTL